MPTGYADWLIQHTMSLPFVSNISSAIVSHVGWTLLHSYLHMEEILMSLSTMLLPTPPIGGERTSFDSLGVMH